MREGLQKRKGPKDTHSQTNLSLEGTAHGESKTVALQTAKTKKRFLSQGTHALGSEDTSSMGLLQGKKGGDPDLKREGVGQ